MPFLLNTTVATSTNIYSLSDALSPLQTADAFFLAFALAFVGLLLVEARTLAIIYGAIRRLQGLRRRNIRVAAEADVDPLIGQQNT